MNVFVKKKTKNSSSFWSYFARTFYESYAHFINYMRDLIKRAREIVINNTRVRFRKRAREYKTRVRSIK